MLFDKLGSIFHWVSKLYCLLQRFSFLYLNLECLFRVEAQDQNAETRFACARSLHAFESLHVHFLRRNLPPHRNSLHLVLITHWTKHRTTAPLNPPEDLREFQTDLTRNCRRQNAVLLSQRNLRQCWDCGLQSYHVVQFAGSDFKRRPLMFIYVFATLSVHSGRRLFRHQP